MHIISSGQPIHSLQDWFALAPPKGGLDHWKAGRSALECARAWCEPNGPDVPAELQQLLDSHPDTRGAVITEVTPERKVRFDDLRGEPRNADVVALATHPAGSLAISIEAKADEAFDVTVNEVLARLVELIAADKRTNGITRIQQLARSLLPEPTPDTSSLGALRYQLLTALAGALAFAIQSHATRAVLVIHEFVTEQTDLQKQIDNAQDLDRFVARVTSGKVRSLAAGKLIGPYRVPGRPLFDHHPAVYIGKAVRSVGSHR